MLQFYLQLLETEEDQQLFTLLYDSYRQRMHHMANDVLRNGSLAEDAVHNAFMGLMDNLDSVRDRCEEDQKNYLLKAAKNAALNMVRGETKQESYYIHVDEAAVEDSVLEALCAKLDQELVVNAIQQISEPYQTVLYYHFVMELEHKEIAAALRRKPAAVRKQLSRGRRILQTLLKEAMVVHV